MVRHERLSDSNIFEAFGHPALVAICSLMILARGLTMTGALEPAVRVLTRVWRWNSTLGLLLALLVACAASGFVNDTPVLVLLLPMLLGMASRSGKGVSRALMPVNFAILSGGMLTSIGTSTNLLVLSIAVDLGMQPMGLFGFTRIAASSLLDHAALPVAGGAAAAARHGMRRCARPERIYAARIVVPEEGDALRTRTLAQVGRKLGRPLPVASLQRGDAEMRDLRRRPCCRPATRLTLNDTVQGLTRDLLAVQGRPVRPQWHVAFRPAGCLARWIFIWPRS